MTTGPQKDIPDSFCIIPWIHLNTWPNGNVFQCCITNFDNVIGDMSQHTLHEVWNNEYMRNLRKAMLAGKKHESCRKCFEQEDNKIRSFRQNANKNFASHIPAALDKTHADGAADEFKLAYWDFRFSNLCNMKCRMCGGNLSSLWMQDEAILPDRKLKNGGVINVKDHSVENLYKVLNEQIDNLEEIYFAGGEPLIMDEHYHILEKLIETGRTDVRLRYNSNISKLKYKKWDVIDLWRHFPHVQVIASIDGMNNVGEYIRKGTVWNTVDQNLKTLISSDHVMIGVSPTIQLLNIFHLTTFIDYLLSIGIKETELHLNNVLTHPKWYHINMLDDTDKERVRTMLDDHANSFDNTTIRNRLSADYESIKSYLDINIQDEDMIDSFKSFISITDRLDKIRNESFVTALPELAHYYINKQTICRGERK